MRQPIRLFLIFLALCASVSLAWADARSDARTHYIAGQKAYAAADYKAAIKEFSAAQDLAPADLNNYNLALCYDKLGDGENAISYYKQYLDKVPDAPKRAEIEASMARLDGALKSSQAKKANEQKEEQQKLDEQKKAQADADAAKKAQADADAAKNVVAPPPGPSTGPATGPAPDPNASAGSTGTPSTGLTVSTGDAQLDRVQGINIDAIRDQRMGGAGSGLPDNRMGPNGPNGANPNANPNYGGPAPNGMAAMGANGAAGTPPPGPGAPTDKPVAAQETPVYKKWWFWVVVAVSAYVVYEIATQDSTSSQARDSHMFDRNPGAVPSGGYTLLRF